MSIEQFSASLINLVRGEVPNFTAHELCIFMIIYTNQNQTFTVKWLSDYLTYARPTISRAVNNLHDGGYISRYRQMDANSTVEITTTAHGKRLFEDMTINL